MNRSSEIVALGRFQRKYPERDRLLRPPFSERRKSMARHHFERAIRLFVIALLGWLVSALPTEGQTPVNLPERGYNPLRTGANIAETSLTPANVRSSANQFHRRFVMP